MLGLPPVVRRAPSARLLVGAALILAALHPSEALSSASIRPDGTLIVDGKPLFPVGLLDIGYWQYPTDWNDRIRQSGANVVWDVESAYADTIPTCGALVDSAEATGYKLIIGSGDTWNWDDPTTPQFEVDKLMYETADIPNLVQCLAAVPGQAIGYVNRDEPIWTISRNQVGDIDSLHVMDTYGQLHQDLAADFVAMNFASVHLSKSLAQWESDVSGYLPATDVVLNANYPYPAGPGTCSSYNVFDPVNCSMDRLVTSTDTFLALDLPGQPLWNIVQAYKGIPLKEMRWEAYASIVHGAHGLLWGGWTWAHPLGNGWDIWDTTVQVMNEVGALQDYLVGNDRPVSSNQADVEVRALKTGRQVAVFAIARNNFSGLATITLPDLGPKVTTVAVANEGRFLIVKNGTITDRFTGYEAHVYEYNVKPAHSLVAGVDLSRFQLDASPNPSSGRTTIRFTLPKDAATAFNVYDTAGRRVATLGRGTWEAGQSEVTWNGLDSTGRKVAPGMYFVRGSTSDGAHATTRVTIR